MDTTNTLENLENRPTTQLREFQPPVTNQAETHLPVETATNDTEKKEADQRTEALTLGNQVQETLTQQGQDAALRKIASYEVSPTSATVEQSGTGADQRHDEPINHQVENQTEPFIEGTGIPERAFQPDLTHSNTSYQEFRSRSGKEIACTATPDAIMLRDKEHPDVRIHMMMSGKDEVCPVVLDTRFQDGTRHPDFNAKVLMPKAIKYLESQGNTINKYRSHWAPTGQRTTIYNQFKEVLSQQGIDIQTLHSVTPDDPNWPKAKQAALSTWSGQQVQPMGFSEVESINVDQEGHVEVVFAKPTKAAISNATTEDAPTENTFMSRLQSLRKKITRS